jgi:acyl-[acyl-carrier-protein]-phospholipid O-acyltransferase/long-chain-fatty-acid--[acyl-carrier-protein] ligase
VKIEGREFIPQAGGVIFAGNHTGWWDSLILICAVDRPIWFLAGPYVFQMPILKHIIKIFNVIPITPAKGEEGLANAVIKLQKGGAICIFPEGSLTKDGHIQRFRKVVSILHKIAKTNHSFCQFQGRI